MKKFLSILLIFVLILSLSGCGADTGKNPDNGGDNTKGVNDGTDDGKNDDTNDSEDESVTITEQVLIDQDGIKVTATEIDEETLFGSEIKLIVENSTQTNITVQARDVSINNLMIDSTLSCDVAAGMKANDSIVFMSSDLEASAIDKIAIVELRLHIFDTDTWDTILDTDPIVINTSVSESYTQSYDDSGELIFEGEGIRVISKGLNTENEIMGPSIQLYIENNSEDGITIQSRNVSVNGFMVEPAFSCEVSPGKKAFEGIHFLNLDDNGISQIDTAQFYLTIFNTDTWDTIIDTDPITLNFTQE